MVLSSLCPYHRNLLYHILKYVREDHSVSVALRDAHRRLPKPDPRCCQTGRKPSENSSVSLGDCTVVRTCCLQTCSLATCAVAPVCVCLKNLHGLACQNVAIGCVGKVICSASAMCYAHRILPCAHQSNGEHAYIAHVRSVESIPVTSRYVSDSHDACRGCRSPSPPPLSPMPLDIESKTSEKNNSCHSQDCKAQSTQPPPLLPHQAEGDDTVLCTDTLNHESPPAEEPEQQKGSLITIAQVSDRSFIDLMDRFTEKLKTIKPPEKEQILSSLASQNSKSSDDTHLREIITTVLHSGKDSNDYNLNELFNRHEANAHRSPQTRSRRRQEVRAAMAKSPDLPASRRQNLQIKMELARLDPSLSRRKSGTERNKCPKNVRHSPPFSPSSSEPLNCPNLDRLSKGVDKEIKKDPTNNQASTTHSNLLVKNAPAIQCNINEQKPPTYLSEPQDPSLLDENKEMPPDYKIVESPKPDENRELLPPYEERELVAPETKELAPLSTLGEAALQLEGVRHRKSKMKPWRYAEGSAFRGSGDIGRSRRNIVPPQRFSSYVTEPRKMYFAACFSESIFIKRSPKSNTSNKVYATETNKTSSTADVSEETTKTKVESSIQDCDLPCVTICRSQPTDESDHLSKEKGLCEGAVSVKTVLPKRSPRTKHRKDPMSPAKTLKPFGTQNSDTKLEKSVSGSVTSDSAGDSTESHSGLLYTSPIKLMFVSPVRSEEGVKYTLKSAVSGPNSDGQMFDPCVVASWGDNVEPSTSTQNTELAFQSPKKGEGGKDKNTSPKPSPTDTTKTPGHSNTVGEDQEPLLVTREPTPVKRRPGRPKKLGPQMEKPAKRPIGRPPKLKTADSNSLNSKSGSQEVNQRASETSCDDANKNLKITIVYGRSRRARRLVSEDLDLPMDQHMCEILNGAQYSENHSGKNMGGKCSNRNSLVGATKDQMEDLNFVRPVKDQKGTVHSSSNIKCQKQSDLAVTRKPGRPPKVKISGISVTVTTVSPRQRKIHMKRDAKDSPPRPRALLPEFDSPSKDQRTISASPNGICKDGTCTGEDKGDNPKSLLKPVRQSLRERKPSIYLLHSIATARSFSHSNALVRKSRKLLLNKANSETSRLRQQGKPEEAATRALSTKTKNVNCSQDLSRLSGISVDSIFQSNEALKWWPTSASTETLNEELARRIRLMSDTWVSDALEVSKSCMEEMESLKQKPCQRINGSAKRSGSAVKMLFESHFNMEKLCSWFMQTTETQSLAIVKKASTRNPPEVFHYNPSRATSRTDFCPSPQAERLRKHVKKFAKVVPKSPTMHRRAQETMCNKSRLGAKRKLFQKSSPLKRKRGFQQSLPGPRGTWTMYRSSLLRARSKFKSRKERTKTELQNHSDPLSKLPLGIQQHKEPSLVEKQPAFGGTVSVPKGMVQNTFNSSDCNKTAIKPHKPMVEKTDISKEERICSKAWSPETLKECRVFLKKINSPDTESTAEECNICTVKLYDVSPSGYSVTVQKVEEEEEEAAAVVPGKTRSSPRKLASSLRCQNKDGRKKDKRKSTSTCGTPPAKMARQSRSSRGMVGARWCDFVLGKHLSFCDDKKLSILF
ncbi:uncharacterized protein LOC115823639 [Chanos chanos]|uniref:Uncharacterized protein LOC115823639 n=1 Tax=Chanos chanos TaxID=29144 RepID=A0A6J2WDI1_CHACN|nr:uncharacterized protein LOC115823639 [Chanos chanos]